MAPTLDESIRDRQWADVEALGAEWEESIKAGRVFKLLVQPISEDSQQFSSTGIEIICGRHLIGFPNQCTGKWGVNVEIPALLSVFFQKLQVDLDHSIQTLQVWSSTDVDTVRKSLAVESFLKKLSRIVQRSIDLRQRQGNRIWAPLIKEQLATQYSGKRTRHESVDEVQTELHDGIKRMIREINHLFIGETCDVEGLALLKTILVDREDRILGMMDALKLRRQEIELHLSP
ncbi:hypothetical protein B0H13DRAFT_1852390 [Mycena leptocephala]|nr:hypothetical protein B0H13DRAFT_1852390 [Mycena leptocephala]